LAYIVQRKEIIFKQVAIQEVMKRIIRNINRNINRSINRNINTYGVSNVFFKS